MAYKNSVDASRMQQFQLLTKTRQSGRRLIRCKKFLWLRLERHYRRRQISAARNTDQALEHGSVAEVNTIEITDCQRHRLFGLYRRSPQHAHMLKIQLSSKGLNFSEFLHSAP